MPDIAYLTAAAHAMEDKANSSLKKGLNDSARRYFALAADQYRQLAAADRKNYHVHIVKAEEMERMAQTVAVGPDAYGLRRDAAPDQKPQPSAGSKPAAGQPSNPPADQNTPNEGDKKQKKQKTDYSGYDIDITEPNGEVAFSDIVGLKEAKDKIYDDLIFPMQNSETFIRYGLNPGGYMLLYGPPGTGKTTFAKAVASEINVPFVNVKCPLLVDKYIGETAKNISKIFDEVRRLTREKNTPVVLFLDEFDAVARQRTADNKVSESSVPTLLQQLDGFDTDSTNIIIIAATNVKGELDSAILSRFNSILIPLPDEQALLQIYKIKMQKYLREEDFNAVNFERMAALSVGLSGRDVSDHIVKPLRTYLAKRDSGLEPPREINSVLEELILKRLGNR